MKKIVVWGIRGVFAMNEPILTMLIKKGEISVVGAVDSNSRSQKVLGEIEVQNPENLLNWEYDYVVVTSQKETYSCIVSAAEKIGISERKCIYISDFLNEYKDEVSLYFNMERNRQYEILREILNAADEEVANYDWMYEKVCDYGIYCFQENYYKFPEIRWSERGMQQVPSEFTTLCVQLSKLREVKSAIEIGVFKGLSSYFMCAVLSRRNPDLIYTQVDIQDRLEDFEKFKAILPALSKKIPSTSDDYIEQKYDYVFIDADHSYDGSMKDYLNVGQYANKMLVFQDIYAHEYDNENGGTVRMWKEVKEMEKQKGNRINEYTEYPDQWMGIGCIELNQDFGE